MMKCAAPTPEALPAALRAAAEPRLILLTGGRGSGKTRWCMALCEAAQRAGLDVAGVISPAVFANGAKIAIDVQDAATGKRRRLAERPPPGEAGTAGLGWRFDDAALAWGDRLLSHAPACDLLIVDELGPLEFRGAGGFRHGFAAIEARRWRLALVVVRPELCAAAIARWPWISNVFDVDAQ
ncbi:MAG: nucleoside-triphosphatase [Tepidimonas sp.]|uniref:nucleoside-triphosphatase n=1 Tax=Tepidimonas sp. TaxID=2002775 RepID=UPI00259D8ED2|nr:nucleoside-triphosphatase [Tepidimonas sp.]MDM7456335.1 nucleoside-triphosphatase [Tepidimonas sp.]